jgi:sugar phosphate isomerase/epimerase
MKFERRTFLKGSICAGMLVGYGSSASAEKDASERIELSLHQLSVGKLMESGALTLAEYPKFAATTLGVKSIEFDVNYCESLLAAPEKAEALRRTSEHFGVKNRVLLCGNAPALDAPEEAERAAALSQHIQWARLAAQLGCENIRVRASTAGDKTKQLDWAATGIGKLAAQLSSSSVSILIENIGGCSRDPGRLIELAKRLDNERVGLVFV